MHGKTKSQWMHERQWMHDTTVDAQETSFDADKCLLVNVHITLKKCDFYMQMYAFG